MAYYNINEILTLAEVLQKLSNVKRNGHQYSARCPAHLDKRNSLSITEEDGRILFHCFAGCSFENICDSLGIQPAQLYAEPKRNGREQEGIEAVYSYKDEKGEILFQVVRKTGKQFYNRRPSAAGGWEYNLQGVRRVLYRYPTLIAAQKASGINQSLVFICEGEKDVETLERYGLLATCNPHGAGKWRDEYSDSLEGLNCVILADNDDAGRSHAETVARSIYGKAASVRIVELPDLPEKGDATDWLNAGNTIEQLNAIVEATPLWKSTSQSKNNGNALRGEITNAVDLLKREFPEPKWIIPGILPEGVYLLAGRPKLGKSWLALSLSVSVATGGYALGTIQVEKGSVLHLALEDGPRRLQKRLKRLLGENQKPELLDTATFWARLNVGGVEMIETWLEEHKDARLIVIDTLKRVRPHELRSNRLYDADYDALVPLVDLAQKYDVCILVIHHTRKADSQEPLDLISGSFGLTGAADGALVLKRSRGKSEAIIHAVGRDLEEDKEIALQWDKQINGWRILGDAAEYRRSKERQEIINLLKDQSLHLKPKAIAEALGRDHNATKKLIWTMMRDGELQVDAKGYSVNIGNPGNSETES
jgi:5S rRNA maturation endonuclease (ribonuclease M5)